MGRYGTKNGPSNVARHFSQLVDGKRPCSLRHIGDVIFGSKTRQVKKYSV